MAHAEICLVCGGKGRINKNTCHIPNIWATDSETNETAESGYTIIGSF